MCKIPSRFEYLISETVQEIVRHHRLPVWHPIHRARKANPVLFSVDPYGITKDNGRPCCK